MVRGIDPKYSIAFWSFRETVRFDHTLLAETIKLINKRLRSDKSGATSCPPDKSNCLNSIGNKSDMTPIGGLKRIDKRIFRPQKVSPLYTYYLEKIRRICQSNKIDCLFLTQPNAYHYEAEDEIKDRLWMVPANRDYTLDFDSLIHISELYNNYLIKFANENKFPLCDLASQIEPSIGNFIDDCHFNLQGAKNVANYLSRGIVEFKQSSLEKRGLINSHIAIKDPSTFSRNETVLPN